MGVARDLAARIGARPSNLWVRLLNRVRIAGKDLADAREESRAARAGMSVADRQGQLLAFYTTYEDFVEAMCDAAQYGPTPRLETVYGAKRAILLGDYVELKPLLGAFLRDPQHDEADSFESLLAAETVSQFLQSDDGETISRITRTREALNLYGEHLRQLADRTG
jgi:hypothetical protein